MNILVVEDDPMCVILIKECLKGLFVEPMLEADTMHKAMTLMNGSVNAVWLDLALPDSPSEKTIATIPEIKTRASNAVIVVVSGWGEHYRKAALDAGADAYASKDDLKGFRIGPVSKMFIPAVMHAMERGVPAAEILEKVVKFFSKVASA